MAASYRRRRPFSPRRGVRAKPVKVRNSTTCRHGAACAWFAWCSVVVANAHVLWHVCLCCDLQKLDEEELEEVREAFNLFDTDGNGTCARFLWHLACLLLLLLLLLWGRKRAS